MPHLGEGLLHAYLDETLPENAASHLSVCAECRANLEKARLLKENAEAILAGAEPEGVAMPSFEELQARARSRSGVVERQRRSMYQLRSLAWAATVVLALAVGWYARSTVLQTGQDRLASEGETRGLEQEESAPDTELDELAGQQVPPDVVGGVAIAADRGESLQARRVSTPGSADSLARLRQAQEVSAAPLTAARIDPASAAGAGAGAGMQQPQEMREAPQMLPQVAAERAAAEPTGTQGAAVQEGDAEFFWTSVNEATAANILNGPVPAVEGLPVVAYATSSRNGRQTVRVHQRLESGQLLELVITPEGDPDQSNDAKKGMEFLDAAPGVFEESVNSVAILRGNLSIRLSGSLATDSLRVLGRKIPPGQ
jgi:hypothetical protein